MHDDFNLFSTLRIERGVCMLLPIHMERLEYSATVLGFAMDRAALEADLVNVAAGVRDVPVMKVRLHIERSGRWHIGGPEAVFPDAPDLKALLWPHPVNSADPMLPHKTDYRPVYDRVIREVHACGFLDAIFHNEHGHVTEGAVHSVFARWGDTWKAPPASAGLLPGVYRQHLLETRTDIREENFTVDELLQADEVWLTNAPRGIRRVTLIQQP